MRIACVHGSINIGGADKMIVNLANALNEFNNEVFFYTVEDTEIYNKYFALNKDIKYVCIKKHTQLPKTQFLINIINLRKQAKKDKIDVIISFLYTLNIMSIVSMLGLKVKVIISERGNPAKQPEAGIWKFLRNIIYPFCDGIVFQSTGAQYYYRKILRSKSTIIHNPVTSERYEPYLGIREKVIVNVARLDNHKNQKRLFNAFSIIKDEFPDIVLRIYGEGDLYEALLSYAAFLNMSNRIDFVGSQNDIPNRIRSATMFVLSSDYEGMPNALIEAMSVGLPCVSTDCAPGGAREIIQNGFNGILCELDEGQNLANAMRKILSDEKYANKLGQNAYKINISHSREIIFGKWNNYIYEVVGF